MKIPVIAYGKKFFINTYKKISYKKKLYMFRKHIQESSKSLKVTIDNTHTIKNDDIISIAPVYNEASRLERYIEHNRSIGVDHMFFIDNASTDTPRSLLEKYDFCTLFYTESSYAQARSGGDWINHILHKYALNHWCLFTDIDEHYIFPYYTTRSIHDLVYFYEKNNKKAVFSTMVDVYSHKGKTYFDSSGYVYWVNMMGDVAVKGGPRLRIFNKHNPSEAPTNVKYALLKIEEYSYYSASSHSIFPPSWMKCHYKNKIFPTGVIIHKKLDDIFEEKIEEAISRKQHWAGAYEYINYAKNSKSQYYNETSAPVDGWKCFVDAGLMTTGYWF